MVSMIRLPGVEGCWLGREHVGPEARQLCIRLTRYQWLPCTVEHPSRSPELDSTVLQPPASCEMTASLGSRSAPDQNRRSTNRNKTCITGRNSKATECTCTTSQKKSLISLPLYYKSLTYN